MCCHIHFRYSMSLNPANNSVGKHDYTYFIGELKLLRDLPKITAQIRRMSLNPGYVTSLKDYIQRA